MKYLPLPDFDVLTGALNFDTPDCRVTGSCDLYTTKAAGTDKKLYKNINKSLESQNAALQKFGASLSPPQRDSMAASLDRSSPFGNLSDLSSRRLYAYLIATLNASHSDYDFSHVLRPADFKKEKLRKVMNQIDNTLSSVRPHSSFLDTAVPRNSPMTSSSYDSSTSVAPVWGPQMWTMIDKEMALRECMIFSYQPADDPFEEEDQAIWTLHYFFFNKARKRVCYLYVRGTPVMSHSPRLRPRMGSMDSTLDAGANKRAKYWLGDSLAGRVLNTSDDENSDDGLIWNREGDEDYYDWDDDDDFMDDDEDEAEDDEEDLRKGGSVRAVSEDIAGRMEIDN